MGVRNMRRVFLLASVLGLSAAAFAQSTAPYSNRLSPYVASPQRVVDRMLEDLHLDPHTELSWQEACITFAQAMFDALARHGNVAPLLIGLVPMGPNALAQRELVLSVLLAGGFPPATAGNPRPFGMPPFATVLSNDDVALLLTHIRSSWGNRGAPVTAVGVGQYRSLK